MRMRGLPCCVKCHTCRNAKSVKRVFGSVYFSKPHRRCSPVAVIVPFYLSLSIYVCAVDGKVSRNLTRVVLVGFIRRRCPPSSS